MDITASATTKHKNGIGYYIITAGFAGIYDAQGLVQGHKAYNNRRACIYDVLGGSWYMMEFYIFREGYKYTAGYRACMKENYMRDGSVLGGHVSFFVMSEAVILGICAAVFCSFQTKAIMPEAQLDISQILIVSVQMFMLIMCIAIPVAIGINELILKIVVRPINRHAPEKAGA